jgi:hypothetical protein
MRCPSKRRQILCSNPKYCAKVSPGFQTWSDCSPGKQLAKPSELRRTRFPTNKNEACVQFLARLVALSNRTELSNGRG